MNINRKIWIKIISSLLVLSVIGCQTQTVEIEEPALYDAIPLYEKNVNVVSISYDGLNMTGLQAANNYSKTYDSGSSLTFGEYDNGDIGCIKNLDLPISSYCGYEMKVNVGESNKYSFWALAYMNDSDDDYYIMLENGIESEKYNMIPFMASDAMSFGCTEDGDRSCLYVSLLTRNKQIDETGKEIWVGEGTYPNAKMKCTSKSLPALLAGNCVTVGDALAFVGAVNEDYYRIYPNSEPSVNVYINQNVDYRFEACALEDSSGRHGILEYVDDMLIWHEGMNYSFNYFIDDKYLLNEEGTYKETYGTGIGRFNAVTPYLDAISTMEDHLKIMDSIGLSNVTNYDESIGHIGVDFGSKPIDWRSEFVGYDVFKNYDKFVNLGLNTKEADEKYPLFAYYFDKNTNMKVLINSYDIWLENKDHLECLYDLNYCSNDINKNEIMNVIKWNGVFYQYLMSDEKKITNSGWMPFIRVVADPMNYRVTRWFDGEITNSDTVLFQDIYCRPEIKE